MFRLTLAQMRRSTGRLVAAGLAIAIGTAFVAATLLAGDVMSRTGRDAVTARFAQADVVVGSVGSGSDQPLTDADVAAVRTVPGVEVAEVMTASGIELRTPAESRWQYVLPTVSDERLTPLRVTEGAMPSARDEIALPEKAASSLGVEIGGTLEVTWQDPTATGAASERTDTVTLVGLVSDPHGAWVNYGGAGLVTGDDLTRWSGVDSLTQAGGATLLVAGAPGTSPEALRDAVVAAAPDATVMTRQEAADEQFKQLGSNGDQALVSVVLGFAAIALLVAALVISNTFQVLVAQRARTLALLRCVGARRTQLRASVLTEATIVGLASSLAGLVAGTALAQGMLAVLRRTSIEAPLPATIHITWQVVVVPLVVGTAVTLLASLVPARAATRVTAIEALRPLDTPTVHSGAGAGRLTASIVLTVLGLGGLGGAVALGMTSESAGVLPLGLGVLAGAVSFVGILLGAVFWVPPVVGLVQRVLTRLGPVPRLAAANTVRNPRRTSATSTALLIGVTLVVMMSAGAASARASLDRTLDEHFPVDLTVTPAGRGADGESPTLPDGLAEKVAALGGVAHVTTLRSTLVSVDSPSGSVSTLEARALSPDEAAQVLRDPAAVGLLTDDAIVLPEWTHIAGDTAAVRQVTVDGTPVGQANGLRAETLTGLQAALVTPETMATIDPQAAVDSLFVSLSPGTDAAEALREVQDALGTGQFSVQAPGAQRAQYDQVINVLLAVVVGLLGVAVLIALLGVTNTLSLSVLERRRESATLRAIGLSRRRLRGTLAIEGMLIAGVGAVLGTVFGLAYGWAGAATVLGQTGGVTLAVPWRDLVVVLVVALAAGLLASVVPARSAVRTPPVAALAEE